MSTYLLGLASGIAGTLAISALFAFGPKKLQNGGIAALSFVIRNSLPFGVMRHMQLKISAGRVKLLTVEHGRQDLSTIRIDDQHEMLIKNTEGRYSFSPWHLIPTCLVIGFTRLATEAAKLEYGEKTTYGGTILKIDKNVSIFTLNRNSLNERLEQWGRRSKPSRRSATA